MTETPMPKVTQLGNMTVNTSLDTSKLREVAQGRLDYARGELSRLNMEFQIERTRLLEQTRMSIEELERGAKQKLSRLEAEYVEKMQPAKEMQELVSRLLDARS
jgi:hypothetical protein